MSPTDRREFLERSAAAGVAATVLAAAPATSRAAKANSRLVMALIGCGGRGRHDALRLTEVDGVEFAYVCDPDERRRGEAAAEHSASNAKPVPDFREALDDPAVDAVVVATPDHWHSPAAILACEAGKHAYVEKPISHNVREGRLLVEAADRNRCIVQHGTQCRSTQMMIDAVAQLREGIIGEVLAAKAWNIQRRSSIGHAQPGEPPAGVDYDLWLGPAPEVPFQANRFHGDWHWWYAYGTGGIGNDGVHDIDYCRWGLGAEGHPVRISAGGGHNYFDDDREFPDTQQVAFDYAATPDARPKLLVYEQRFWSTNHPYNVDSGVEFYGPDGLMFLSRRGKVAVWDAKKQRVPLDIEPLGQDDKTHTANFVAAIRDGDALSADAETGHLSASLCHLGNIATRLGRTLNFDPASEQVVGDDEANQMLSRKYRPNHWADPTA
ncbi:MAG: Gfo/Idh/MocA family oxidoreductase [Pirellulales bacterium]